jgi:predicted DNA-binding transcriptional regulator AlpA
MSEMTLKENTELITLNEMSELYGYQRSSLGVMAGRYETFPKPVGVEANTKYFPRAEIAAWFEAYLNTGGLKLGNGRAHGGRGVSLKRYANPLLDEILTRIGSDLVLQSKVLLYLEQVKEG